MTIRARIAGLWAKPSRPMMKIALSIVLLATVLTACSSVISNSEGFYKNSPRRRINWREYLTD